MSISKLNSRPRQKGQATVEFALAALIFFTVFLAIVEFSHLFYVRLTLQHALREAGRFMITGRDGLAADGTTSVPRCDKDPNGALIGAVLDKFKLNLKGFGGVNPPTLTITSASGTLCGDPEEAVTLTASYTKPWFSILASKFNTQLKSGIPLSVSMTWLNEPFPASGGGS